MSIYREKKKLYLRLSGECNDGNREVGMQEAKQQESAPFVTLGQNLEEDRHSREGQGSSSSSSYNSNPVRSIPILFNSKCTQNAHYHNMLKMKNNTEYARYASEKFICKICTTCKICKKYGKSKFVCTPGRPPLFICTYPISTCTKRKTCKKYAKYEHIVFSYV
jgi:hypothetical protein